MEISNIDDLLMGTGNAQQPTTPEHKEKDNEDNIEVEYESDSMDSENDENEDGKDEKEEKQSEKEEIQEEDDKEEDEYGNKKERMSKGMKERLDRKEKQFQREIEQRDREVEQLRQKLAQQGASTQVQQAAKDFEYDPNSEGEWQQQLSAFIKQTVQGMTTEQQQREKQMQEEYVQREFHQKFTQGMDRFSDFREVVGEQPIDDAMTLALRGMSDPSAFIYAASKRNPKELERISKLSDPYARMVEMGKLEERMRKNKPVTKAPRPLGRTREDASLKPTTSQKDSTGDDLLAKADAKRLSLVRTRHKSNR